MQCPEGDFRCQAARLGFQLVPASQECAQTALPMLLDLSQQVRAACSSTLRGKHSRPSGKTCTSAQATLTILASSHRGLAASAVGVASV